jgi:predicted ATPase
VSVARLWRDQGKYREARDLLFEVYGRFTEGLSTTDLSEAHAILQEVGAAGTGAQR